MKTALFLAAALALGACAGRAPEPVTEATASALCAASGAPTPECISAQMAAGGSDADARDTFANRNLYDLQPKGFSFLAIDTGFMYFKLSNTSGDWSDGV